MKKLIHNGLINFALNDHKKSDQSENRKNLENTIELALAKAIIFAIAHNFL